MLKFTSMSVDIVLTVAHRAQVERALDIHYRKEIALAVANGEIKAGSEKERERLAAIPGRIEKAIAYSFNLNGAFD